ncbi:Rad52/Rad22 family DNA repair protein [Nocardia abscessus]|uniref:Rad52/Rad22 family DNA repair protein n=1 Tax=Nocardia abscessus TaxID=120957 RepID=UPI002455B0B0|nr:Rad52/Rad22 family DNA repair protein [Nocardia abscessus]
MPFSPAQINQLLAPIKESRVLRDGKGNNHLPQQDVLAHLIRVFGFGGFDYEMLSCDLLFESRRPLTPQQEREPWKARYDVAYKAFMRLTVRDPEGNVVCQFEDGSSGDASNQTRADAHDLAMKSAISLAKKRCAIALGDQFGLSLYNKGQTDPLVIGTLVRPALAAKGETPEDVQANVPESQSMGIDETDRAPHAEDEPAGDAPAAPVSNVADRARDVVSSRRGPDPDAVARRAAELRQQADDTTDVSTLGNIWKLAGDLPEAECVTLRAEIEAKVATLPAASDAA